MFLVSVRLKKLLTQSGDAWKASSIITEKGRTKIPRDLSLEGLSLLTSESENEFDLGGMQQSVDQSNIIVKV